jgi:hypothetical protein
MAGFAAQLGGESWRMMTGPFFEGSLWTQILADTGTKHVHTKGFSELDSGDRDGVERLLLFPRMLGLAWNLRNMLDQKVC